MSAARLTGALCAFAACALYGAVRRSAAEERLRRTEGLLSDIRRMGAAIGALRLPLARIASELAEEGSERALWRGVSLGMEQGLSFAEAYKSAPKPRLGAGAEAVMSGLAASVGGGDAASETASVKAAAEELSRLIETERGGCERQGRLMGSLSMLLGLGLALLLL